MTKVKKKPVKTVKKAPKKKPAKKRKSAPKKPNVMEEATAKKNRPPVRVSRCGFESDVEMGNSEDALAALEKLEENVKDLKHNPEVQELRRQFEAVLDRDEKGNKRPRSDRSYADKVMSAMRKDANDKTLDYKVTMPFIGSDRCEALGSGELRGLAEKLNRKERHQRGAAKSFVSYYKKILSLKNNHIKMLNEEVDVLRRKTQLLEARLNENENAIEELLVVRSLKDATSTPGEK